MKPWEETWDVEDGAVWTDALDNGASCGHPVFRVGDMGTIPRTKLAAAAPDLVRALLVAEWTGRDGEYCHCPVCGYARSFGKHAANCQIDAALRKAGAR
jgi:hypothetical protein